MGRNADAIAEGEAIAVSAARLELKNRILVTTIAADANFDTDRFMPQAREVVDRLAVESEQAAEALRRLRKRAWGRHSQSHGTHDYRDKDVRNLRRRAKQSIGVAKRLRELLDDTDRMRGIIEQARDAAWQDVRSNIDRRLNIEAMRPDEDPDYDRMREARMQALRLVDLQSLASQMRARKKVEGDDGGEPDDASPDGASSDDTSPDDGGGDGRG
ncbi:asparagine synthase [Microbacterium halotolerans]|uniref:asparagine synthase n=1 Tax=Microbacterium halotolerans TaxID=246613 RepID=UPI001F096444|nr:asparagine synthase [Microbacterium halotolerans]